MSKIDEICSLIPQLQNEIDWTRGQTKKTKDAVVYKFKNGSQINILAATESSRGQRRTGGVIEESILMDGEILNDVIIPTTNVDRLLADGSRHPEEVVNKSLNFITTAGWKNSFAYMKLVEMLVRSMIEPKKYCIMGGTFRTPVKEGLLNENFVEELQLQGTFNDSSFDREYRSIWSGSSENAYFDAEVINRHRQLLQAEKEFSGRGNKSAYYILSIDVGRHKCTTEIMVWKINPMPKGETSIKSLVNIYSYDSEHFETQAIQIKRLFEKFHCHRCIIDGNGLGTGLVDFLTITQVDPQTGEELVPFGVENDEEGKYKKLKTDTTIKDALYIVKANAPINTEAYSYTQAQLSSGKVKLLIDERDAKLKLMSTKVGQAMTPAQRNEYLMPYVQTSILKEQLCNLVESNEGINIILKQESNGIKKDKASAFFYGLYYMKLEEDRNKKRRKFNISDLLLMN